MSDQQRRRSHASALRFAGIDSAAALAASLVWSHTGERPPRCRPAAVASARQSGGQQSPADCAAALRHVLSRRMYAAQLTHLTLLSTRCGGMQWRQREATNAARAAAMSVETAGTRGCDQIDASSTSAVVSHSALPSEMQCL